VPRAIARRRDGYIHDVEIDGHTIVSDEPASAGGADQGPSPTRLLGASLAACAAITVEMYADRKGWDLGPLEVVVDMEYHRPPIPSSFLVTLKLPRELSTEQRDRIQVIAAKCPVHRVLTGEVRVSVEDRVELV
jgi:putative redox protein